MPALRHITTLETLQELTMIITSVDHHNKHHGQFSTDKFLSELSGCEISVDGPVCTPGEFKELLWGNIPRGLFMMLPCRVFKRLQVFIR